MLDEEEEQQQKDHNPRPRSNISAAWTYFKRIGSVKTAQATCTICGTGIAVPSGSTTGMFSHLQKHHPQQYREAKSRQTDRYMMNPRQSPPVAVTNPNPLSLPISPKTPGLMSVNVNHSVAEEEEEQVMETDLVFIKANDELHLTKTIYPEVSAAFGRVNPGGVTDNLDDGCHDVIISCSDGRLPAHKLVLGSASPFLKSLFTWRDLDIIYLPDYKTEEVRSLVSYVYTGSTTAAAADPLDISDSSQFTETAAQLAQTLGISVSVASGQPEVADDIFEPDQHLVIKEEPTDNYNDDIAVDDSDDMATFVTVNPVVEISTPDIPTPNSLAFRHRTSKTTAAATALGTPSSASYRSVNRSPASSFGYAITNRSRGGPAAYAAATTVAMAKTTSLTSRESELEKQAMELKNKIYAECSKLSAARGNRRPTRLPSKIWNWFIKTQTTLTCKVCGGELRNCGNTTNAACHLRKHPKEFQQFRKLCDEQDEFRYSQVLYPKEVRTYGVSDLLQRRTQGTAKVCLNSGGNGTDGSIVSGVGGAGGGEEIEEDLECNIKTEVEETMTA